MSNNADFDSALVPARASTLVRNDDVALAKRVLSDLYILENAEDCYRQSAALYDDDREREAFELLERAIILDPNHASASLMLGCLYWIGSGVQEDLHQAEVYLRAAAELGLPAAQIWLGFLLKDQGSTEAYSWLRKAAEQDAPQYEREEESWQRKGHGALILGEFLEENNTGAFVNNKEPELWFRRSQVWFRKAVEAGQSDAQIMLDRLAAHLGKAQQQSLDLGRSVLPDKSVGSFEELLQLDPSRVASLTVRVNTASTASNPHAKR